MEIHWKLFELRIRDDAQDGEAYERPCEREDICFENAEALKAPSHTP